MNLHEILVSIRSRTHDDVFANACYRSLGLHFAGQIHTKFCVVYSCGNLSMTSEEVFRYYRAYKFYYSGTLGQATKGIGYYAAIKCPELLAQQDRQFYWRLAQRLSSNTIHALFTVGFFHNPKAHISALATPEAISAGIAFESRAQNGETLLNADLYELQKKWIEETVCQCSISLLINIDRWLYGETDNGQRVQMPGCLQEVINETLPVDLACLLLLVPRPEFNYQWLKDISPDPMGLGSGPWIDRLQKLDLLLREQRPDWRVLSHKLSGEFWRSVDPGRQLETLTPMTPTHVPSLF